MQIPLVDLHAQYQAIKQDILTTIEDASQGHGATYHEQRVIHVQERDHFRKTLEAEGITAAIHYPIPIHLQPACVYYGYKRGMLPVTEDVTERSFPYPCIQKLKDEQKATVVNAIKKLIVRGRGLSTIRSW